MCLFIASLYLLDSHFHLIILVSKRSQERSCPRSCAFGGKKQVREISDKTAFACSSGARMPFVRSWTPGAEGEWTCCLSSSVGTLASTTWKWGGGMDIWTRVSSWHRMESWPGWTYGLRSESESWERYHLGGGTRHLSSGDVYRVRKQRLCDGLQ